MLRAADALANLGKRNKPVALEDVQVPADRCLRELEGPRQIRNGIRPARLDYLEDAFSCTLQRNVSRPERPVLGGASTYWAGTYQNMERQTLLSTFTLFDEG